MKKTTLIASTLTVVFVVIGGMFFLQKTEPRTEFSQEDLTEFATCLKESGAKFYGAFWCSHCRNQKAAFKEAVDALPYIECSTEDSRGQTDVCKEAGITSYPTWEFSNGTRLSGEVPFADLAQNSGCSAPTL